MAEKHITIPMARLIELETAERQRDIFRSERLDLALLVGRLIRRMRAARTGQGMASGDDALEQQAVGYLRRKGLTSPLREDGLKAAGESRDGESMLDLKSLFEKHADEFLKFDRVRFKNHPRPDVCAFMKLHDISPHEREMIRSAEHDEIWLDADVEAVAARADEDQIVDLIRCGVRYDPKLNLFCMFV